MAVTKKQLEARAKGIFASESAAALGLSRWATPLDVYRGKRALLAALESGEPLPDDSPTTMARMGNSIEGVILDWYETETGQRGQRSPDTMFSKKYPWLGAHLDWLGSDRVVDAKLTGGSSYGEPGTDDIPQEVLIQVHQQMLVAERDFAQVAVFAIVSYGRSQQSGLEYRSYDVPFNKELGDLIIEGTGELWRRIQNLDPPSPSDLADMVRNGFVSSSETVKADAELMTAVVEARELNSLIDNLSQQRDEVVLRLKAAMRGADTLVDGRNVIATWKTDAKGRSSLDTDRLRAEHPRIWARLSERYMKVGNPARRFLLKGEK